MSGIFISYSQSDRAKAQMLAAALEHEGWSVWWDLKIPPGKTFDEVIKKALNKAKCVIVLWSRTSVRSNWVKTEASVANRRGILVPALIDDHVEIPLEFFLLHASRLTDWQGQPEDPEFVALKSVVAELLGDVAPPHADGNDTERRKTSAAAATPQEHRVKREDPETMVGGRARSLQIPGFLNPGRYWFWILGLSFLVFVTWAGFIWLKPAGTPANLQPPDAAAAHQPDKTPPDPKPPADGDKQSSPPRKTPLQATQPPAKSDSIVVDGKLTWTRTDNGKDIDWNGAIQYCQGLTLDGLSRWRLPTIDELKKLYDPKGGNDHNIRNPFRLTNYIVWSSTREGSGSAFDFRFGYGGRLVLPLEFSYDGRALCVRGSGE